MRKAFNINKMHLTKDIMDNLYTTPRGLKCIVPVDVHHEDMGSLKASTEVKVMFQYSLAWAKISTRPAACWS